MAVVGHRATVRIGQEAGRRLTSGGVGASVPMASAIRCSGDGESRAKDQNRDRVGLAHLKDSEPSRANVNANESSGHDRPSPIALTNASFSVHISMKRTD